MENRAHALVAGFFVLLLGAAMVGTIWYFGGARETTRSYLLETRRNVNGLNVQAQVRYRGIRAGKVEDIALDAKDPKLILVRIGIDARYPLTKATTARLGYQGVTGLAYVQLEDDGSSGEPLVGTPANLPRIPLRPSLLDTLGDKAGDIVERFSDLSARLNRLLDERNAGNIARTLENAATASESLKEMPAIMAAMREALSEANLKRLKAILASLEKTAGEAAPLTAEARALLKSMSALSARVDSVVAGAGGQLESSTLPQVDALIKDLGANSRRLARLLETLEEQPQALVFGRSAPAPGPGEAGFVAPVVSSEKTQRSGVSAEADARASERYDGAK